MKITPKKIFEKAKWFAKAPYHLSVRARKAGNLKPRWLVLSLTNMCNSKCTHCSIWKQKKCEEITHDELIKALKDPLFSNLTMVSISGGEPILRPDIKEIILDMSRALPKAKLWLSTNGILADKVLEVTRFALANNVNFGVGVSIDGVGEHHDKVRGVPGNFKKADYLLNELDKIRKSNPRLAITIGFTLSDLTADYIWEVKNYAKKFGIDLTAQLYDEASFYFNEKQNNLDPKKTTEILKSMTQSLYHDSMIKAMNNKLKYKCFALYSFCVMNHLGNISPCLRFNHLSAGNIKKNTPTEIWNSLQARKVRETVNNCKGCLNTWGVCWSMDTYSYRVLEYMLRNLPRIISTSVKNREISL